MRIAVFALLLLASVAAAGCSGGSTTKYVPRTSPTNSAPTPSNRPTASATPSANPSASAAATKANAAAQSVQNEYASLPHASASADLASLAAAMVASGQFKAAAETPGGISATLPDGTPFFVFGDHLEDPSAAASPAAATRASVNASVRRGPFALTPAAHHVVLFNNMTDQSGAFNPMAQQVFTVALNSVAANAPASYAVDNVDVQLSTIAQFSAAEPIDVLDIATHGMVAGNADGSNPHYLWLSETPVNASSIVAYGNDILAGNIAFGVYLVSSTVKSVPVTAALAFAPGFLLEHVVLNPGAIVINESCFGQFPTIAQDVQAQFKASGAGRYFGWNEPVDGDAADQTDAFIFDRLIGESQVELSVFVTQRDPAQRPFPLDDIEATMQTETRDGPGGTSPLTYAQSPGSASYPLASLRITDLGGELLLNPPIFYGLPSIARMQVAESPTAGTLSILGTFPAHAGTIQIQDPGGTVQSFNATSWSTSQINVQIPASSTFSRGLVTVKSADGIPSNAVALTQWTATLQAVQKDTITEMSGDSGSGSGEIDTTFTVDFRADVHPTVPSIDASPVPQNLTFARPEADSVANVTSITGSFLTDDGDDSATFGLSPNPSALTPGAAPVPADVPAGSFGFGVLPGQPTSCNSGQPGPGPGPTNVFCPAIGYVAPAIGTCDDDAGTLCTGASWSPAGIFGSPAYPSDGLLVLTMDPKTYAITITSNGASGFDANFESPPQRASTGNVTGTVQPPVATPPPADTEGATSAHGRRAVR